jgi:hypothetical protein
VDRVQSGRVDRLACHLRVGLDSQLGRSSLGGALAPVGDDARTADRRCPRSRGVVQFRPASRRCSRSHWRASMTPVRLRRIRESGVQPTSHRCTLDYLGRRPHPVQRTATGGAWWGRHVRLNRARTADRHSHEEAGSGNLGP